jgi:hypothetical protein
MLRFDVKSPSPIVSGELVYRQYEYSLDFTATSRESMREPHDDGITSIAFGTLQISVAIRDQHLLYAWGYFPHTSWLSRHLSEPTSMPGRLFLMPNESRLISGVAIPYPPADAWNVFYDHKNGWIYFGPEKRAASKNIEIANGVIVSLHDAAIVAIWLRPKFEYT